MASIPDVSVIMPTRALPERALHLRRARESVLEQRGVRASLIVVVNGPQREPGLVEELEAHPRVRLTSLEAADLPAALRRGRELVETPWFAELDDDDVLLPGALRRRVDALRRRPDAIAAVDNGLVRRPEGDRRAMDDVEAVRSDPLRALLRANWLLPGSWLCRSDAVGVELFEGMPECLECTYLAARLALTGRVRILDEVGVVWHKDLWPSASSGRRYVLAQEDALGRILELDLPSDVARKFRRRLCSARHAAADLHLEEGNLAGAWAAHLRSLVGVGGWRHLPSTRRFLRALWAGGRGSAG